MFGEVNGAQPREVLVRYCGSLATGLVTILLLLHLSPAARAMGDWTPEVRRAIDRVIARHRSSPGRKVVIFDFDNTLIFNGIGRATVHWYLSMGLFKASAMARRRLASPALIRDYELARGEAAKVRVLDRFRQVKVGICHRKGKVACTNWQAALFSGLTPAELRREVGWVIRYELNRRLCDHRTGPKGGRKVPMGIRVYEPQRKLIRRLTRAGFEVWIVSASFEEVVRAFAPTFGVPQSRVLGVKLALRKGRIAGHLIPPMTYRPGKVAAIKRYIGVRPLMVFGDAITDKEMMEYAGELAVLIDRGRPGMVPLARSKGWKVQPAFVDPRRVPRCGTRPVGVKSPVPVKPLPRRHNRR